MPTERRNDADGPVCAWCDVYCRTERAHHDEMGRVVMADTVCAYCGRSELRLRRLGRQTPIPDPTDPWEIDG